MAQTDWYNTNEHIQYPFCPYEEDENELKTNEILDCHFFLKNAPSSSNNTDSVWLSEKEITESTVSYTFKCTDTSENAFEPLIFEFERTEDWQGKWVYNDDWYGFVAIGRKSPV